LIDGTASLQYTIELAIAGKNDGPPSAAGAVVRLDKLRKHREAWDTLTWSQDDVITMARGHVWELFGGVLSQYGRENTFMFWQLPSTHRGIEAKHWSVHLGKYHIKVRDFTIDPTQDLLVIVESPNHM
jgi:hypothetical protein